VAAAETIRICDEALAEEAEDDESATALRVLRAQAGLRRAAEREQEHKNQNDDEAEAEADFILAQEEEDVCAAAQELHTKLEAAERAARRVAEDPEVAAMRRQHKRWWRRCQEARAAER